MFSFVFQKMYFCDNQKVIWREQNFERRMVRRLKGVIKKYQEENKEIIVIEIKGVRSFKEEVQQILLYDIERVGKVKISTGLLNREIRWLLVSFEKKSFQKVMGVEV